MVHAGPAGSRRGRLAPRSQALPLVLLEAVIGSTSAQRRAADPQQADDALNIAAVVDRFAAVVEATGGTFLGVADLVLQASWPVTGQGASAAARALDAARKLAALLERAGITHTLRVAVVAGSGLVGSFGGVAGRWCSLASGLVACRLRPAMGLCAPGFLVYSAELRLGELLGVQAELRGDGFAAVPLASATGIGEPPDREGTASGLMCTPCSVVALEICGADCQRSEYPARLHGAVRSLQRASRLQGGELVELRHDHRGVFALVLVNALPGYERRAAVRALRLAYDLGQALADQGLDMPAGVASGSAWTWPVGSRQAAVGPAVQRAVALARSTTSELACDSITAGLASTRARLDPSPAGSEPGFLVEHVEPSRADRWAGASGALGRRAELTRLDQLVGELLAGTTGVLLIEGELGLGKSRMADELVARVRDEPCRVVVCYAEPGAPSPLAPWRGALLQLLGCDDRVDPAGCRERLDELLGERVHELDLDALGSLLPIAGSGRGSAPATAGRLLDAAAVLIQELQGGSPLLVVFEDGQWLDSASWSLARQLAVQAEQLLLCVTLRTDRHELELEAQRLAALPETTVMVLRGLSAGDLALLVQQELGIEQLPEHLLRWLRTATRGNPRLCLEWVRLLQDEGQLRTENGQVVAAPSAASLDAREITGLPALLEGRVSMIPPSVRRTLAVCTAAAGMFETELIASVHPDASGRLRVGADLEHLATVGLLQPAPGRFERAWTVTHAAVANSVVGVLDQAETRRLHGAIATWYEQRHDDLSAFYPLLAQHWIEAGGTDQALRYLELAGAQAMRAGAMPEAARHFQQALRLAGAVTAGLDGVGALRAAHWERSLGDARYACGELERCAVHYGRALELLGERIPRGRLRLAGYAAWQLGLQVLHRLLPLRFFEDSAQHRGRLVEASHAAERLAERYYYSADAVALCSSSVLSANLADRVGVHARNARPYASMSYLLGLVGLHGLSERVYQRAVRIGQQAPDPTGLSVARYTRATFHAGRGQWELALELGNQAVAEAENAMAWQESGVAHTIRALCQFQVGAFGLAEASYGELSSIARERYNAQHEAWALYGVGECQLAVGRLHEAARSVQRALAVLRNLDDHPSRLICHGVLASIHARMGQLGRARESAELAWAQIERVPFPFVLPTIEGYAGVADAYLVLLAHEAADGAPRRELLARAKAAVRVLGHFARVFPIARPRYLVALGRLASLQGKPGRAAKAWRGAIDCAQALGMPFELALAQAALASSPGSAPERAVALAAQAAEGFEALGCDWHLQRLRDQQGQSQ